MRILQVVSYYPPASSYGGPPQVMFDLGKELTRRGHSVHVFTTDALTVENWNARAERTYEEIDNLKIHRFARMRNSDKLPSKFLKFLVTGVDRRLALERKSFDVVHISEITHPLAVKCSSWARKNNIPYAISIFGNLSTTSNVIKQGMRRVFDYLWGKEMIREADALLVQTPHEGQMCAKYTPKGRTAPMPLPVDIPAFEALPPRGTFRKKYSLGPDEKIVLFLGRLHRYKGIELLADAFAKIASRQVASYRLVIAGADEGYGRPIAKRIQELRIEDKVIFTGPIFGRDKLELYVDADVFATTPTIYEETSLAALEACACGTPVIVTERNAILGLEEYKAGFQIYDDKQELSDKLVQLLANDDLRREMGTNARRLIEERYACQKVADSLESLFHAIARRQAS